MQEAYFKVILVLRFSGLELSMSSAFGNKPSRMVKVTANIPTHRTRIKTNKTSL
jgi:hypothetical protein